MAISFCITVCDNEKEYVLLLLKSLRDHTDHREHEFLVLVDSDNQGTTAALNDLRKSMPSIKIHINPTGNRRGYQTNLSLLFGSATNDVVCYLQSDMVVGKDFDKYIIQDLTDNTILSCARIEPPLHPPSPEKIIQNFGFTPNEFDYNGFNKFVDELQSRGMSTMFGFFAPFAMHKKTWFDLGGFDTQFRCSREDSDFILRARLNGVNLIQSWNACVYHFTCVSSRGKNWYNDSDPEVAYNNSLQQEADKQELFRYVRKWGKFTHDIPISVYDIGMRLQLDRAVDINILVAIEPFVSTLYLDNQSVVDVLRSTVEYNSEYYSNLRWKYTPEHWKSVKHRFNPTDFKQRIKHISEFTDHDVVLDCTLSSMITERDMLPSIQRIHDVVDANPIDDYSLGSLNVNIQRKNDQSERLKHLDNVIDLPDMDVVNFV